MKVYGVKVVWWDGDGIYAPTESVESPLYATKELAEKAKFTKYTEEAYWDCDYTEIIEFEIKKGA